MSEIDPYNELMQQTAAAKERFASDVQGATMTVVKGGLGEHRYSGWR
ncbi:hypothetical protein [Streptomyces sp. NPDC048845]